MDISQLLKDMNKKFGEDNSIHEFGENHVDVEVIPTGIPSLDYITGVGGFPRGRIIEIYGGEGAGKTTIALKIMAEAQRRAGQQPIINYTTDGDVKPITGRVALLDVEHAFSTSLAELHGVKLGKDSGFYFDQPMGGDEALDKLYMMVSSNLFDVIVVDSVSGLTTLDEREQTAGESVMAGTARLMSTNLKKLTSVVNKSRTIVIFINQIREKPAVKFGSPETTSGGRALKFYSSMRIRISKKEQIKEGSTQQIGHTMGISIKKNKLAPPFGSTDINLYYRDSESKGKLGGFDIEEDLLATAKAMGVVELKGSQYRYVDMETGELFKANGMVAFNKLVKETDGLFDKIVKDIMEVNDHEQ